DGHVTGVQTCALPIFDLFESGADGRRADYAVNAGGRPAADEDREIVMVRHKWMIPESDTVSGAAGQKSRCARVAPLYNPLSGGEIGRASCRERVEILG